MIKYLLVPLLAGSFVASRAQAPVITEQPHNFSNCLNTRNNYTTVSATNTTGASDFSWQVSTDGGTTWTTISSTDPDYGSYLLDPGRDLISVFPQDASWNLYQYRCVVTNASGSVTSSAAIMYMATSVPGIPTFVNPPSEVCQGEAVTFQLSGPGIADTVWWLSYYNGDANASPDGVVSDNPTTVRFNNTGAIEFQVVQVSNGCGYANLGSPISTTVQVNPVQSTLAGVAGEGQSCSTFIVYPDATGTTFSDANCDPIDGVIPSGSSPVTGAVTSCVTLASTVPTYNGIAYVPRYYSLEPAANASTSTATITLYFTQSDFDAYNGARGSEPALPTGPTDATGIANLTISQFHGTGTTPDTYVGTSGTIIPTSVVWNSTTSLWSVTFSVTGFSGFFVSGTSITPLPLTLANFSGQAETAGNLLSWQTASEENTAYFEVQRAIPGTTTFEDLGRVAAAGNSSLTRQYNYTDALAATHPAYSYRLRMVDVDGRYTYSPIVTLQPMIPSLSVILAPNPFVQPVSLTVASPAAGAATVVVIDMSGAKLVERSVVLQKGDNALDVSMIAGLPQGVYFLQVTTGTQQQTVKFVKE